MKEIANFLLTTMILWGATKFFPEHVSCKNFGVLLLISIIIFILECVLATLYTFSIIALTSILKNIPIIIIGLTALVSFLLTPLSLIIISNCSKSFEIHGT